MNVFQDVCVPIMAGKDLADARRIGIALDAAIAFGAIEYANRNPSIQDLAAVKARYNELVEKLREGR